MDRLKCACVVLLSATSAALPEAWAGTGTFSGGKYNFCVSVRFNATPAQLANIRAAFTRGSEVLADATDGQHRFGRIRVVNDSGGSQQAEYWVHPNAGRAVATYGKFAVPGEHVNMYYPSNFTGKNGADGDAYTIAHEHAHHSWGVGDEYAGPDPTGQQQSIPAEDAPLALQSPTLNYSLMDNYFTRGGRAAGGAYTLNEFCTAANHDPDHNTWQHAIKHQSVWETIAAHPSRAATMPAGLPVSAPPAPQAVDFGDGSGMRSTVLLIDRSGSMASEGRLAAAKASAQQFIGSYKAGDGLGLASFSDAGSVDQPLAPLDDTSRAIARTIVGGLAAGGSTNIGGGLLTALGQFTAQANRSCQETIVLLTDGEHNVGTPPEVGMAAAQAEEVQVLTVGLGDTISTAGLGTLKDIATKTGGNFYHAPDPSDLHAVFLQLTADASGQGMLARARATVGAGQPVELPVLVEQGAGPVTFAIAVPDAGDVVELAVRSPSGVVVRAADAAGTPGFSASIAPNSQVLTVNQPEPGNWTLVTTASAVASGRIEAMAFAEHDGVQLLTSTASGKLAFPAAVEIHATPHFDGRAVAGASVTGMVRRPDGTTVPIDLFDDGKAEHADEMPGDGVYGARFEQYQGDGSYRFELQAANLSGKFAAGEALFADEPSNATPVVPFNRVASTTVVVSGVPAVPVFTVEHGPETLNFKSDEQVVTVTIEVTGRYTATDIAPETVRISAVDGVRVPPLYGLDPAVGDADQDGVPDLRVRFNRKQLQALLGTGTEYITLEGTIGGEPFTAEWTPKFVNTGKPPR